MNNKLSWTDIVAAVVVMYGAVLSTITFIKQIMDEKPRGKVIINPGTLVGEGIDFNFKAIITFINIGKYKVNISTMGIILPNGQKVILIQPPNDKLPKSVEPGESITNWMEPTDIRKSLDKTGHKGKADIIGFSQDATGKLYKSKSIKFSL